MSVLDFIGNIFKPAADIVDSLHVSDEERGKLKNALAKIQSDAQGQILDYQTKLIESQAKIQVAEATSDHWLRANWRPISALIIVAILVLASFGVCSPNENIYELGQIIFGTYIGGRTLEKVATVVKLGK